MSDKDLKQRLQIRRVWSGYRKCFWITAAVVASLDLLSKSLLFYPPGTRPPTQLIKGFLAIQCSRNTGGVFGMGQGRTLHFVAFSIVAIAVLVVFMLRTESRKILPNLALGVLLGGAVGNLYDRIFLGYVRDFIDLYWRTHHWPTFNVADAFICVGVGLLFVDAFIGGGKKDDG